MLLGTYSNIGWVDTLCTAIINIINPVLILIAVAGICYSVLVGIKFARAEDKTQREEAKQKLITVIIGVAVTAILIAVFYWLALNVGDGKALNLDNWFGTK